MTTALTLIKKINSIDILKAAQKSIRETSVYGEDAQRQQLFSGLDKEEKRITNLQTKKDYYARKTVEIKKKKGQPTDRITLKDTGDYYSGLKIDVEGEKFKIYSVDEKADLLDVTYSPLGLGKTARMKWLEQLRPEFLKNIKSYLS